MTRSLAPTRVDYLSNGMRILTRELHHAPLGVVMVWYAVGSRNEKPGFTGISHFLEHMMFKGTPQFPSGVIEEGAKRRGGMWNAFTSYDYTAYYEVLPARHLEFGLAVEADRMVNMTFDSDLTARERGIIVSEREGSENRPSSWLHEVFMQEVFRSFPYGHMVLGHKDDIKATTAAALTDHYQRYYRPNNATLVVAGDFETDRLLEMVQRHFGPLAPGAPVQRLAGAEPAQTAERRCTVRRPGPNPHLMAGYRMPAADHPDQASLTVLAAILSGAPSMSAGGGGMGRSSRFHRKVVSSGTAAWAGASPWGLEHGGLFLLNATPVPGISPERLEEALFSEVEALRQGPVPSDELERAKKQVRAQFVYAMESAMNQARILGATALTQGVARFDNALQENEAVTADDVLRVAQTYLDQRQRTIGWFLPEAGAGAAATTPYTAPQSGSGTTPAYQQPRQVQASPPTLGVRTRILDQARIVRQTMPGGATLLVYPAKTIPSLLVRVQMEAGPGRDPVGKEGLAQMTAQLLTRGSRSLTAEELALKTDSLGMSIRVDTGRETAVASLKCLPEDMATGLGLMAEVLRAPTFPQDEMDRMRDRLLLAVREADSDTRAVAAKHLLEGLYPEGHPYRSSANGTGESLQGLVRADLEAFHQAHYGPSGAIITVVGNVDPAAVQQGLLQAFAAWSGGSGRPDVPPVPVVQPGQLHVAISGKSQADIALGWTLVDRSHPDFLALEFLATLFGGNGTPASSRLFRDVRERYGLSYYQFASFGGALGPAAWTTHIGVNPARVDFAIAVLKQELRKLTTEVVPAAELEGLQSFLQDFPAVQHESPERVAARLAELERFGLGLDYVERYPDLVRSLTAQQLQDVAARHLDVDRLFLVIAGPEGELAPGG